MGEWRFNESSGDASLFLSKEKEDKKKQHYPLYTAMFLYSLICICRHVQ